MELLRTRAAGRDEDDGVNAVYECQACLNEMTVNCYRPSTYTTCPMCGWDERDQEES